MFNVPGMDPISSHQAGLFMNGEHQTNCKGFELKAQVDTKESRVIGQQATKPRVRAVKYVGTLTFYKRSTWLRDYVKSIQKDQYLPPFDIQGVVDDPGSDFGKENGPQIVTFKNCVPTGDITVMMADAECNDVEETISIIAERME